jgi:amino acid transporter
MQEGQLKMDTVPAEHHDSDDLHLASLGYKSEFKRDMSPWANFSLGFTYLSPVVGVYTVFAYALAVGGPPMFWSFFIVGLGQLMVALIFSEVVAQYPVAGGVYPWARRLWGRKYAWMTGWVYLIALLTSIAGIAYGAGPYFASVLGFESSLNTTVLSALIILGIATIMNFLGTKVLAICAIIGFVAELVGALVVGFWLIFTERYHNLGVLFDSFGAEGDGSYLFAFAAAALIGIFQYYGFEACGDVAEEVKNPGVLIPKAMRRTIYIGGAAATFVCLTLILAVQDIPAVIAGEDVSPVDTILFSAFGPFGARVVLAVVAISFISCIMSLQAAASRLAYSYGRDDMIIGSQFLKKFSPTLHIPPYALIVAAIIPAIIILGSTVSENAVTKIVSFAGFGIYLGFQMVVLAALRARLKGWKPSGKYQLGKWGLPVNIIALVYGIIAIINMCWPRTPDAPWYDNYLVPLSGAIVVVVGLLYMAIHRSYGHSNMPYDTAIPKENKNISSDQRAL